MDFRTEASLLILDKISPTLMRIWHQWGEEVLVHHCKGSQQPRNTNNWEDHHHVCLARYDHIAMSSTFAQQLDSVTKHPVSAHWVRHLQQQGMFARRPLLHIPLTLRHRCLRLQLCQEWSAWMTQWHNIMFSNESLFGVQHYSGQIRVCQFHRGSKHHG